MKWTMMLIALVAFSGDTGRVVRSKRTVSQQVLEKDNPEHSEEALEEEKADPEHSEEDLEKANEEEKKAEALEEEKADPEHSEEDLEKAEEGEKKAGYEFVHVGLCADGWLGSTITVSIEACESRCRRKSNCAYFGYAKHSGSNCAMFGDKGCLDDNEFPSYKSYRLIQALEEEKADPEHSEEDLETEDEENKEVEVCADTPEYSYCGIYASHEDGYCEMGKVASVRRRDWGAKAKDNCRKTCGYCQAPQTSRVLSGPCTIDANGCAMSPNYPDNYGKGEACSLFLAGYINSVDFETDTDSELILGVSRYWPGVSHSGPITWMEPPRTAPAIGAVPGSMTWTSDDRDTMKGWKICTQACKDDNTWLDTQYGMGNTRCNQYSNDPIWCNHPKHVDYSVEARRACPVSCKVCQPEAKPPKLNNLQPNNPEPSSPEPWWQLEETRRRDEVLRREKQRRYPMGESKAWPPNSASAELSDSDWRLLLRIVRNLRLDCGEARQIIHIMTRPDETTQKKQAWAKAFLSYPEERKVMRQLGESLSKGTWKHDRCALHAAKAVGVLAHHSWHPWHQCDVLKANIKEKQKVIASLYALASKFHLKTKTVLRAPSLTMPGKAVSADDSRQLFDSAQSAIKSLCPCFQEASAEVLAILVPGKTKLEADVLSGLCGIMSEEQATRAQEEAEKRAQKQAAEAAEAQRVAEAKKAEYALYPFECEDAEYLGLGTQSMEPRNTMHKLGPLNTKHGGHGMYGLTSRKDCEEYCDRTPECTVFVWDKTNRQMASRSERRKGPICYAKRSVTHSSTFPHEDTSTSAWVMAAGFWSRPRYDRIVVSCKKGKPTEVEKEALAKGRERLKKQEEKEAEEAAALEQKETSSAAAIAPRQKDREEFKAKAEEKAEKAKDAEAKAEEKAEKAKDAEKTVQVQESGGLRTVLSSTLLATALAALVMQ